MRLRTLIDNINYVELVNMDNMSDEIMGISYNSMIYSYVLPENM